MIHRKLLRRGTMIVAALALIGVARCNSVDELLEANNPAQIREDQLNEEALIGVMVNSVIGSLTGFYTGTSGFIWSGSMLTDEQVTGLNWETQARFNQRILAVDDDGGMFGSLSRYRFLGDSIAGRLRNMVDEPAKDLRLALVLAHAGYAYTLMGEIMCSATINIGADIYTPVQLAQFAIPRFEEAIAIATAAPAAARVGNAQTAADVINMARTGLARAALLAGDKAKVMSAAAQVPLTFNWWVEYKEQIVNNGFQGNVTGANHNLGVHPRFLNGTFGTQDLITGQTDPRIQHTTRWTTGHNALTKLYKPYQSLSFSGFNANATIAAVGRNCEVTPRPAGCPILYEQGTDVKLASGIEAMHHYYEAAGPTGTGPRGTTLQFVNERRAFGKQSAVTLSGAELMAELREQRARDLYMGGFRLGDLRRYAAQNITDPKNVFPSGPHPNAEWGPYGDATCYNLPRSEYIGNPNIRR